MEDKNAVSPEINRLYWETEESVSEISNRLGVSRRAMYELIEPLPSGIECASCRAELYYNNRSARAAGVARCVVCGSERELDADISHEDVGMIPQYPTATRKGTVSEGADLRQRTAMIAGFALAGVVAGALVALLIRRKR